LDLSDTFARQGFRYQEWRSECGEKVEAWLDGLNRLEPVVDLYLAALRRVGLAEVQFQLIVQALETYHRRVFGGQFLSDNEWQHLKTCLTETVTEFAYVREHSVAWLEPVLGKLAYMNELSLARRLNSLFNRIENLAHRISGTSVKRFVRSVVATRNHFTHWSGDESEILSGAELAYATSRLTGLLELLLLLDAGFGLSGPAAAEIIRRRITQVCPP
jgi:hypothetical protein